MTINNDHEKLGINNDIQILNMMIMRHLFMLIMSYSTELITMKIMNYQVKGSSNDDEAPSHRRNEDEKIDMMMMQKMLVEIIIGPLIR